VNIAARLESIAEPGGICISSSVYDQVRGKVGFKFTDLGEQNLKNIVLPVRAYALVRDRPSCTTPGERASLGKSSRPLSLHRGAPVLQYKWRSRAGLFC
jgi:hypothetical protein